MLSLTTVLIKTTCLTTCHFLVSFIHRLYLILYPAQTSLTNLQTCLGDCIMSTIALHTSIIPTASHTHSFFNHIFLVTGSPSSILDVCFLKQVTSHAPQKKPQKNNQPNTNPPKNPKTTENQRSNHEDKDIRRRISTRLSSEGSALLQFKTQANNILSHTNFVLGFYTDCSGLAFTPKMKGYLASLLLLSKGMAQLPEPPSPPAKLQQWQG